MNIVMRELKATRKSLLLWSVGILALIVGGMSKYGGLENSGQSMNDLLTSIPKSLQAILGIGTLDISTAIGYFAILYSYLLLMMSIHASMLGANIISKEERDKTVEFLLAKPVSRRKIMISKWMAAFINICILNMVTFIFHLLCLRIMKVESLY